MATDHFFLSFGVLSWKGRILIILLYEMTDILTIYFGYHIHLLASQTISFKLDSSKRNDPEY